MGDVICLSRKPSCPESCKHSKRHNHRLRDGKFCDKKKSNCWLINQRKPSVICGEMEFNKLN